VAVLRVGFSVLVDVDRLERLLVLPGVEDLDGTDAMVDRLHDLRIVALDAIDFERYPRSEEHMFSGNFHLTSGVFVLGKRTAGTIPKKDLFVNPFCSKWIPAFAGMTSGVGDDKWGNRLTNR